MFAIKSFKAKHLLGKSQVLYNVNNVKIGIDISQTAYGQTGVSNYLLSLVENLVKDKKHEFVLLFSSLRREVPENVTILASKNENISIKKLKYPPSVLHLIWNKLHIMPVDRLVGNVDFFITSDWTEPPLSKGKKATILYDLIVYKFPQETAKKIIEVQKKKLQWVKRESDIIFCISESTKKDAAHILGIDEKKLKVIYPGV